MNRATAALSEPCGDDGLWGARGTASTAGLKRFCNSFWWLKRLLIYCTRTWESQGGCWNWDTHLFESYLLLGEGQL